MLEEEEEEEEEENAPKPSLFRMFSFGGIFPALKVTKHDSHSSFDFLGKKDRKFGFVACAWFDSAYQPL